MGARASADADEAKWTIERNERQLAIRDGDHRVAEFVFQDAKIPRPFFANVHATNGIPVSRSHPPVSGKGPCLPLAA
ncbi:MAG: hypothetical protein K2X38_22630 [Gemmataceae bacterium]|nr:hypothetical protein [Gemmataceae bacterium]